MTTPDRNRELTKRLARVARTLTPGSRPFGCRHVVAGAERPLVCAIHPEAGLFCVPCARAHARRHDRMAEFTCDLCHREVARILAAATSVAISGVVARTPRRHVVRLSGAALVFGLGLCRACADRPAA